MLDESDLREKYKLSLTDSASKARTLIEDIISTYSTKLDETGSDGRARLLRAYSRMVAKQETLVLAQELHTKKYANVINRGRTQFLTYLETTGHISMRRYTIDDVMALYKDKSDNLVEISAFLSPILPSDAEAYLSIYTSKDLAVRKLIIKVGTGRKVETCVGHSAACTARSAAAWFWRAVNLHQQWAPMPGDPTRGVGCPFYCDNIKTLILNKHKLDLREGRGKVSAQLLYIEDHVQFNRKVVQREVAAFTVLEAKIAPPAGEAVAVTADAANAAWAMWASKLVLPAVVRFTITTQREGGQRAELTNLKASELSLTFDSVHERPTITKKRQGGTEMKEACRLRHWGCGPYCHSAYVLTPDESMPRPAQHVEELLREEREDDCAGAALPP